MRRRSGNKNKGAAHNRFVHGMTGTPTYKSWSCMKSRCLNPSDDSYPDWGGRGIRVCDRWLDFNNFLAEQLWFEPEHRTDQGQSEIYPETVPYFEDCDYANGGDACVVGPGE